MPHGSKNRELLFLISDVGRLLRTRADQKARLTGMTRAQWAVLLRLERMEGLMQSDLAYELDIQPITLTRLVDRLCESGLIERRPDPRDRRAKLLFLTPAARPLLEQVVPPRRGTGGHRARGHRPSRRRPHAFPSRDRPREPEAGHPFPFVSRQGRKLWLNLR